MRHDHTPGINAYIDVNGLGLDELEVEDDGDDYDTINTTRYVEAVAGSSFTVNVIFNAQFPYRHDDINCEMHLDGQRVCGSLHMIRQTNNVLGHIHFRGRYEATETGTYLRKFHFSDLNTNDGSVKPDLKDKLKSLGTINVKLTRCVTTTTTQAKPTDKLKHIGDDGIPEKGLKGRAISTRATLGAREKSHGRVYWNAEYPYGTNPFAEFTFKYRSHKDLQVEGIISRSPSPVPLEDRDRSTLTADELRQLLEQREQEMLHLSRIKTEKRERSTTVVDEGDDGEVTITHRSSKRHRTFQDSGVEVVDLTDD